jgi:hypothetical protein
MKVSPDESALNDGARGVLLRSESVVRLAVINVEDWIGEDWMTNCRIVEA